MKEINNDGASFFLPIILMICISIAIGVTIYVYVSSPSCQSGLVTDKYILSDSGGYPVHYFVLDNSSYVKVDVEIYYKYDIGDYYKPC